MYKIYTVPPILGHLNYRRLSNIAIEITTINGPSMPNIAKDTLAIIDSSSINIILHDLLNRDLLRSVQNQKRTIYSNKITI